MPYLADKVIKGYDDSIKQQPWQLTDLARSIRHSLAPVCAVVGDNRVGE